MESSGAAPTPAEMSTMGVSDVAGSRVNSPAGCVSSRTPPSLTWSINIDETTPGWARAVLFGLETSDESDVGGLSGLVLDPGESALEIELPPRCRTLFGDGLLEPEGEDGATAAIEDDVDRGVLRKSLLLCCDSSL